MYKCRSCINRRLESGVGSPDIEVTDGCEPLCVSWDSNLGPLQEQPVLLIAELSLQPYSSGFTQEKLKHVFTQKLKVAKWKPKIPSAGG